MRLLAVSLFTCALIFAQAHPARASSGPPSVKIKFSLHHDYSNDKRRKLGQLKGRLIRDAGTEKGRIWFPSLNLTLLVNGLVENPDVPICGLLSSLTGRCRHVREVAFNLNGSQVSQVIHAILEQEKDDLKPGLLEDARFIVSGCIDARYAHANDSRFYSDHCSVSTLFYDASYSAMTPLDREGTNLSFVPHGGSAAGFSFDLANKIELTNYSRDQLPAPRNQISYSSLMLWIELGDDHLE